MLLDLDGDGGAELVVQMVAQPHQFNAVFHYGDGELSCWQYDIMEMSCRDYPLGDGAWYGSMTRAPAQSVFQPLHGVPLSARWGDGGVRLPGGTQDTQEDGDGGIHLSGGRREVDQDTFAAEFEELVGSRLLSLEDWTPATERPG